MHYFYYWDARRKVLHSHSGEFEYSDTANEYHFETNDGSGKRYLHCKPDGTTYIRNQVILEEKNDLLAVETLISKAEASLNREDSLVTQASLNSLNALKDLRKQLQGMEQLVQNTMPCLKERKYKMVDKEERYITLLDGYQVRDDVKFTLVTNAGDCGSHCCGVFDTFEEAVGYMMKSIWYYKNSYKDDVIEYTMPELLEGEGGYISTLTHNGEWYQDYYILFIDKEKG